MERRWTIRRLARESGISHSTLSNYERQVSRPSLANQLRLATLLTLDLSTLGHPPALQHHLVSQTVEMLGFLTTRQKDAVLQFARFLRTQ